jgi:hypothetical protein
MKRIALIAAAALALSACQHTAVARPDASKLVCKDEPAVPAPDAAGDVTDEQDATYKTELRGAWHDCYSAVGWLRDWFSKLPD